MKRPIKRAGLALAHLFLSLFIGWHLVELVARYSTRSMPDSVHTVLVAFVRAIGHEELYNPDDMHMLGATLYWLVFSLIAWLVIGLAYILSRRRRTKPRGDI